MIVGVVNDKLEATLFDRKTTAMNDLLPGEPTAETVTQIQTLLDQRFAEIEQLPQRMHRDQAQIEASGARTDAMLKQIQAQLARLQAS